MAEHPPIKWYRSTIFAAFLVACTAFTCPGIFGALNGMGAGGGASPGTSNAANAIVFGTITVGSPIVGIICNWLTPKWTLVIGTLGYVPYAAGFYVVDRFGEDWLLLFGAVLIGISGCFLWVSSGAIFLGYSEEHRKGFAASIKFAMQNLGASVGGFISLGLNVNNKYRGGVTRSTYIVLMTIMGLGWPFALALPPASRIQRSDGRPVAITSQSRSIRTELRTLGTIVRNPAVLAMMPLFIYAQWFLSYQWQFNFAYFSVRSRALNSTLFYLGGLIAALLFGQMLDWQRFTRKTRARVGLFIILVTSGTSWILGQAVQVHYTKTNPTLDWEHLNYGLGCFLFLLWGMSDPLVTTFTYWIVGSLTNDVNESAYLASLINSLGSLGSTFGFVVSAMNFSYDGACAINLGLFWLAVPGAAWVAFTKISNTSHGRTLAKTTHQEDYVDSDRTAAVEEVDQFGESEKNARPQVSQVV